ncbi:DNA phosphorothioation-dependent restriction protein DptH [Jeotgalibacillus marinus]|uniref:DNA phosphorothioation-dependent restriction protein DptH n=1 Tax=Jeotgalibacillus marinus TaxID=86667 RepID=A0ABV3Q648_9BACL
MSNQFFDFIAKYLSDYFRKRTVNPGERYYLRLNSIQDVENFKTSLENSIITERFIFELDNGEQYITNLIPISDGLVVAYNNSQVSSDFLVTLRNRISDQEQGSIWEGKALLSIISSELDSITGGSISLVSGKMPLHPDVISEYLKENIGNSISSSTESIVLEQYLEKMKQERQTHFINFYDFQDVFKILDQRSIEFDDYKRMGLFKDDNLVDYSGVNQRKRLEKNRELFSITNHINENNLDKSELEKYFMPKEASTLAKDEWEKVLFSKVQRSNEDREKQNKKTKVELLSLECEKGIEIYKRQLSETVAGRRKYQVIIFSDGEEFNFDANISIKYSEQSTLKKSFVSTSPESNFEVQTKKSKITVGVPKSYGEVIFGKVHYKHENKIQLGVELNICVIPISSSNVFENHKHHFEINVKDKQIILPIGDYSIDLGEPPHGFNEPFTVSKKDQIIEVEELGAFTVKIDELLAESEDPIQFRTLIRGVQIPIRLEGDQTSIVPITPNKLRKIQREEQISFNYNDGKVTGNEHQFSLSSGYRSFIELECQWLRGGFFSANYINGYLKENEQFVLPEDLSESYSRFINSFIEKPPSLVLWTENVIQRAKDYLNEFISHVENMNEERPAGSTGINIFNLGLIRLNEEIWLTPFHPINVAYKIQEIEELRQENVDTSILDRLRSDGLLPYIYGNKNEVFSPDQQENVPGWILYKKKETSNVLDADLYLNKVIKGKLDQFKNHFTYYFIKKSKAPFKIQVINILNDYQVIRGILDWYLEELSSNPISPVPIEIKIFRSELGESYSEIYTALRDPEELEDKFKIKLKVKDLSKDEIFKSFQRNIRFSVQTDLDQVDYSHIAFYKMHSQQNFAVQNMEHLASGVSLNGLYSSTPSKKFEEDYRTGYGTEDMQNGENFLIKVAYYVNELSANLENEATNTYVKGRGIVSRTSYKDLELIKTILEKPIWVTFVDPGVELDFFENLLDDLIVIHYSDQYSSSSKYDAVTVTSRSKQFNNVIEEYLDSVDITTKHNQSNIESIISAFNTINGEWLLKIVGSKGYFAKEKLSIIAAIKATLAYLNHKNILWVPISLEEVLRVAGAANLNKKDGIFTAKNLGVTGQHSDDLLFIGLEDSDSGLKFHLHPMEVKVGRNEPGVMRKAEEQIQKTVALLEEELINKEDGFVKKFYQNFFIQLFVSNAKRIEETNFWPKKEYKLTKNTLGKLKKGDFTFNQHLHSYIGQGSVFSFNREMTSRSNNLEGNVLKINLLEEDVKRCLLSSVDGLEDWLTGSKTELVRETILKYCYSDKQVVEDVDLIESITRSLV